MTIKYLACYDTEEDKPHRRAYPLAAATVIPSVLSALRKNGHDVEVISFSSTKDDRMAPGKRYSAGDGIAVQLFHSFGRRCILGRAANRIFMKWQYCTYLFRNIQEGDVVIAYHTPYYVRFLRWLKRNRSFHLVLQMLEVYADVTSDEKLRKQEAALAEAADAFIFSTELLADRINRENKPAAIMLGSYHVEQDRNVGFDDGKIHVLYAGTLDPRKGGCAAAEAAAFLPKNYHVHILGFGSEREKAQLLEKIEKSRKPNCAAVTYDGVLSGEAYIQFVQKCHIGLCTQKPDAQFNDTSFPSKVLSYLANGLRVVSVRIRAVESSAVNDLIVYYDEQSAQSIAKAIMSVDMHRHFDGRARVNMLYERFTEELDVLLRG